MNRKEVREKVRQELLEGIKKSFQKRVEERRFCIDLMKKNISAFIISRKRVEKLIKEMEAEIEEMLPLTT